MRLLLGLLRPSSGHARGPASVGYLPEVFTGYPALSVRSYLRFIATCKQVSHADCARVIFFFQAEDGIRDKLVTGVQTCALPISNKCCLPSVKHQSLGKRFAEGQKNTRRR